MTAEGSSVIHTDMNVKGEKTDGRGLGEAVAIEYGISWTVSVVIPSGREASFYRKGK